MYRINLYFKPNINGVYTNEEVIATDMEQVKQIKRRMIDKWFDILCPHIEFHNYAYKVLHTDIPFDYFDELYNIKIQLIDKTLDEMDMFGLGEEPKEYFKIYVEKIKNI